MSIWCGSANGDTQRFTVRSLRGAANNTPYWIVQVPRQLIPGHSGFFTDDTLRLIGALIDVSGAVKPGVTTEMVHDSRVRPNNLEVLPDALPDPEEGERAVYEIVIDGFSEEAVANAMKTGLETAAAMPGVLRISAGNYGGKLGPHHFHLHKL